MARQPFGVVIGEPQHLNVSLVLAQVRESGAGGRMGHDYGFERPGRQAPALASGGRRCHPRGCRVFHDPVVRGRVSTELKNQDCSYLMVLI